MMVAIWPPEMLTQEQAVEFKVLARRGLGIREIAKRLGCSRNTVRRYLREAPAPSQYGPRAPRPTKLDPCGVPQHVLFDNAGTIVIERDVYGPGQHRWHPQMLALAEQYGFTPRLCRPHRAKTKGKVECFNGYLKGSFCVPLAATLKQAGLRLDVQTTDCPRSRRC
jgi:transposase